MKNIVFVASESVPFIKTGGLADVVGSLPKCFNREAYDVRVVLPYYSCIKPAMKEEIRSLDNFYMDFNGRDVYVGIMETEYAGVKFYFIDNQDYFNSDSIIVLQRERSSNKNKDNGKGKAAEGEGTDQAVLCIGHDSASGFGRTGRDGVYHPLSGWGRL